jgi:hypothetical protein
VFAAECPGCVEEAAKQAKFLYDWKILSFSGAVVAGILILGFYWIRAEIRERGTRAVPSPFPQPIPQWAERSQKDQPDEPEPTPPPASRVLLPPGVWDVADKPSASKAQGQTKEQLYKQATLLNIKGRSRMNKSQLLAAVNREKS